MKILTVGKIVFRIAVIIAVIELFIMLFLGNIPHDMSEEKLLPSSLTVIALLNPLLLVLFASPLVYFWVVRPFVDERNAALSRITVLAHYDPLTNLANRRLINQNLKTLIAHCNRRAVYSALLLIDLDCFKSINDIHGHDAGDAILVEVAKRLTSTMRDEDVVGRIGGDEFVILIDQLDQNEQLARKKISMIAEKLRTNLLTPVSYKDETLTIGASIGIVLLHTESISIETAFKHADIAMYQAKKGTLKHVIFSEKKSNSSGT